MKSIILTAQDVRDLQKSKTLVIEKPVKGEGYAIGDVVYIREPWYNLRNPNTGEPSGNFSYAANAVCEPVAYKWASPVAMPAAAIRLYARVTALSDKESVASDADVAKYQEITLEPLDPRLAKAADAGLPISTAEDEDGVSTPFEYKGDMSPEDHAKMCAAAEAAKAADEKRLEEIAARRREIELAFGAGVANKLLEDELNAELDILGFEEREICERLGLDDYVPGEPTDEEKDAITEEAFDALSEMAHEERRKEISERLSEIKPRLETLSDIIGSPDQFTAEAVEDAASERDELVEEVSVLEKELAALNGETTDEGGRSEDESPEPTDPDEEIGSFTLGECKFCGRTWGITLEGAPGGGYPTQKTANAAATRLCDCPEAVENRTPIVGVALAVTTGACRHCGQLAEVGPHPSQRDADETASEVCSCPDARLERRVEEQVEDACDRITRLFGEPAEELGFAPLAENGSINLLERVAELIARRAISSATIQVRGTCKAKLSLTTKGKIKVARSETRSYDLEAGE